MSRPNNPPKPQMPKPGTDDEYMNLFFSQTESPFSALNRELHEVEVCYENNNLSILLFENKRCRAIVGHTM